MMNKYLLFVSIILGFVWSCSDSELQTPGNEFLDHFGDGSYVVEVNGLLNKFEQNTHAVNNSSLSTVNGANANGSSIAISIPQNLAVGHYDELDGAKIVIFSTAGYFSNVGPNGILPFDLNITAVNNSQGYVTGTFSGSVVNSVTGEIRNLTNGKFIKINFPANPSSDRILKGKFNGLELDFSTNAQAQGVTTAAVISGQNTNSVQTLNITIPNGISVGTFTEEQHVVVRVNLGTTTNPSDFYSNYDTATDTYLPVTLTISSINLGENGQGTVTGSFSGEITKFINGQPTEVIEITSGVIKVPIGVAP